MYKFLLKPLLFQLPAETAHRLTMRLLRWLRYLPGAWALFRAFFGYKHPALTRQAFGLTFPNPVGLAAGFDKNAELVDFWGNLGFGFIEIGTVTPRPQVGNPQPRLFRLPQSQALINRMGFNNEGIGAIVARLKRRKSNILVGGNIGKNKDTPNEKAVEDYVWAFEKLYPVVDYFTVNVSSPNTPNLRALQEKEALTAILQGLQQHPLQQQQAKPILLKIAPDLNEKQLDEIIEVVKFTQINGLIISNTTLDKTMATAHDKYLEETGGLSGQPLKDKSTAIIRYISDKTHRQMPIIGVGGIASGQDALEKLQAGACLVQIYTGLVYEGPQLVKQINQFLAANLQAQQPNSVPFSSSQLSI